MLKFKILTDIVMVIVIMMFSNISYSATVSYTYDNLHRLTRIERPNGVVTVYRYDELGNRTLKVTTTGPIPFYCDNDQDNYIDSSSDGTCNGYGCEPANCQTTPGNDCNDGDSVINPNTSWYQDADTDNYGNPAVAYVQCAQPSGPPNYVLNNGDYNDSDPNIYPGGPQVRIAGTPSSYHTTLQAAYDAASDGASIQVQAITFNESLSVNVDKTITISGGYNGAYSSQSGMTTIQGSISVTNGSITVENIIVQ